MTSQQKRKLAFIVFLTVVAIIILTPTFIRKGLPEWWPAHPIRLGLDLKGGVYLVLGVKTEEAVKSTLSGIATAVKSEMRQEKVGVLRARAISDRELEFILISAQGVPSLESRIARDYPQIRKTSENNEDNRVRIIYRIGDGEALEIEKNAVEQAIETIRNRVDQFGVAEPQIQRSADKRINVQLPDVSDIESVKKTIGSVAKLEFRLVTDASKGSSGPSVTLRLKEGGELRVEDDVVMSGDSIEKAFVDIDPSTNQAQVSLKLTPTGSRIFENITGENVGRQLAIVLDGVVQSYPVIKTRIGGGRAQIEGNFSPEEAHWLALVLRAGALPAPLEFLEQRTVGASLGADSIRSGVIASLAGCVVVMLFMIGYYQKSGVVAVCALWLNILFLLSLLALVGSTLTLPGIAGIALTIGMAVDANVLIYERMREEIRNGVTKRAAIDAGFHRAHWTIVDANVTTLLSGIILYGLGTGAVRGFAVTLCIGIVTSLFAALFVTRVGFEIFKLENRDGKLSIGMPKRSIGAQ